MPQQRLRQEQHLAPGNGPDAGHIARAAEQRRRAEGVAGAKGRQHRLLPGSGHRFRPTLQHNTQRLLGRIRIADGLAPLKAFGGQGQRLRQQLLRTPEKEMVLQDRQMIVHRLLLYNLFHMEQFSTL